MFSAYESSVQETLVAGKKSLNRTVLRPDPNFCFHIVVETIEGNLSAGMRQLNGVYTQWHNRTRATVSRIVKKGATKV